LKIGASNLLNTYYYSFIGGPSIGGFYYVNVMYAF
jgi:iron complex outermembrane receptor protein